MINKDYKFNMLKNRRNKIIFGVSILILCLIITVTFSVNLLFNGEVKSVEIESSGWKTQEPGSWHIDKSADWIELNTARVTFDVESVAKMGNSKKDIILVLDISGSMSGERLDKVKEDAKELVQVVLSDSNNSVALISFHSTAEILSGFTNDKENILSLIDSLSTTGATNYTDALIKVGDILKDYEKKPNDDLVTLFLSDGYPCVDTPNQIAEFTVLKDEYPYLTINAIQYEMGSNIIKELQEISHGQFSAYKENLQNVLFDAAAPSELYEKFVISDYIDERYFELGTIENVNVSVGEAELTLEDGMEKVTWNLSGEYRTGSKATMTIDIKLKDSVTVDEDSIFPTNRKEKVEYKLFDESEKNVDETVTPELKALYKVIYEANTPPGCTISNISIPKEMHSVFETVTIKNDDLSNKCSGYLFKGWEMTDESSYGTNKLSDDIFVMPSKDVTIRGVWSQVSISKSMVGEEYQFKNVMPFNGEPAVSDNISSEFVELDVGIDFSQDSSDTNGKGLYIRAGTEEDPYPIYYYRGAVENNNVLFANKCWKIVRTTETGGTKLIYNGLPNSNNTSGICANKGTASQLSETSAFNTKYTSPAYVGYMYGVNNGEYEAHSFPDSDSIVYGNDITYSNGQYTLKTIQNGYDSTHHYTCRNSATTCTDVAYVYGILRTSNYYLLLSDGDDIESIRSKMFANIHDSTIKVVIDNWFSSSDGIIGYSNYLEDTIWCNNRNIASGALFSNNSALEQTSFETKNRVFEQYQPDVSVEGSCPNKNDRFTVSDTIRGNGSLTYPVGLITGDEISLAGISNRENLTSFLYTGSHYWGLSPYEYGGAVYSWVFFVSAQGKADNGFIDGNRTLTDYGVRPSISLKQGVTATSGTGTVSDPYRVG